MRRTAWDADFGLALMRCFDGSSMEMMKSAGPGSLRHVLHWRRLDLDVSVRPRPAGSRTSSDCAQERALDADASLSAVSIDEEMQGWCEALYKVDRKFKRISYYPNIEPRRLAVYQERMHAKFPSLIECFMTKNYAGMRDGGPK